MLDYVPKSDCGPDAEILNSRTEVLEARDAKHTSMSL